MPFNHDAESLARSGIWNLVCPFGEFDLSFRPSGTDGYDDLVRDARTIRVGEQDLPVASLGDIIRSKRLRQNWLGGAADVWLHQNG